MVRGTSASSIIDEQIRIKNTVDIYFMMTSLKIVLD
jgi:hypothetical protein